MTARRAKHVICLVVFPAAMCWALGAGASADPPDQPFDLREVYSLDLLDSGNAETIAVNGLHSIIVASNSGRRSIDFYMFQPSEDPAVRPLTICGGMTGVPTIFEPTSVAIHPRLPIAFAVTTGATHKDRGRLIGLDLRPERLGSILVLQQTGIWPDSVAISPDGRWLVIANEAEEDDDTPGSIEVVDLGGLDIDACPADQSLPCYELSELPQILEEPAGRCEPEFVAFDPQSRFAAVSCQGNDSVVIVDLQRERPQIVNRIRLTDGAQPDGVAVLASAMGPGGKRGCLIGIAEEGGEGPHGRRTGNAFSLYWVDPDNLASSVALMSRVDVRPWVNPFQPDARLDPEAVLLTYYAGSPFAFLGIERSDSVLCVDIDDPINPKLIAKAQVGSRPELIASVCDQGKLYLLTADEGADGTGSITLLEFQGPDGAAAE
jgi:hypothetical protein